MDARFLTGSIPAPWLGLLLLLLAQAAGAAAVIEQNMGPYVFAAGIGIGQTFVWPADAPLGIVRVQSDKAITATLKLYAGTHTCDDSGGEFHSQWDFHLQAEVYSTLILNPPVSLDNGGTYTFCVYNQADAYTGLHYSNQSYYGGGTFVADSTIDPGGLGGDLQFTLDVPLPVYVFGVSPASGPPAGGTAVTITGTGFTGAYAVNFGKYAASSFAVDSDTQISAVAPAGTDIVDVVVVTAKGTSPISDYDRYSFEDPNSPPRMFITSVAGPGDLSLWDDAHGYAGLQAADEICRSRAAAGLIARARNYVAFLSDSNNDAYCRVHGATGRVYVNSCNAASLPTGAGPWYRMDGEPAMDVAQNSLVFPPDAGYVPHHILFDEFGVAFAASQPQDSRAFTGTMPNGVLTNPTDTCGDWGSTSHVQATAGDAFEGYGDFWDAAVYCDESRRLICLESGTHGPALPHVHPHTARVAFVTSSVGTGDLSSWPDADGATGTDAGDNICRAHAQRAHLPLADSFKAWLASPSASATERLQFDGPLYRTDNARVAVSIADLTDGELDAPLQLDEKGQPVLGYTWTGALADGQAGYATCSGWTYSGNDEGGHEGHAAAADASWTIDVIEGGFGCGASLALYCIGDNDSIFLEGFE